jgi:DeoR family transcriptional regulator, fructose operon transcriptional repressor
MIERSGTTIVVADYSKIGRESYSNLGPIDCADYLVTNADSDEKLLHEIGQCGITVLKA